MGQRFSNSGFSLVEVMVGAAILLISALAVAYLVQGRHIPKVDSLKACQDINEEVLAQINALGNGDFSPLYGTDTVSNLQRYCPPGVCGEGGIGLSPGTRWSSQRPLTTTDNPPVVHPHILRMSSINYLLALYKSGDYCSGPRNLPAADLDIFNRATENNILQLRQREGTTRIQIQALLPGGAPFCPDRTTLEIRPSAAETGHTSPVLDQGVVSSAGAADSTLGFRVSVSTTYTDPNNPTPQVCLSQKEFFYQSEYYRGQVTSAFVGTPPFAPTLPPDPVLLPACTDPTVVTFTKSFMKSKRDSVLLCRNRSQIGAWAAPAKCDPSNPSSPNCSCDPTDGCLNTWATFTPAVEPPASLAVPPPATNPWFPCDQLPNVLMLANIVDSPDQVEVKFVSSGNGGIEIEVLDLKNEVPIRLPKKVRIDVIEVDAALNSSADKPAAVPGDELATLKVDFFGHDPGLVCEDCDNLSNYKFVCAASCPVCCDSSTECCDGDSWPSNSNCPDPNPPDPEPDPDECDNWASAGYSSRLCCETDDADSSCGGVSCDPTTDCCNQTNPPNPNCPTEPPVGGGSCTNACAEGASEILSVSPVCQGTQLVTAELRTCEMGSNGCTEWKSVDISDACLCPPGQTVGCSSGSCTCTP